MTMADPLLKMVTNGLFKISVRGLEQVDFSKPTILTPNHTSLLDAAVLALNLPDNVCFVVNSDVAKQFSTFMKFRRHITVDPMNPLSVRKMIRLVQQGTPLLIFPEGRITRTGGLMKIYSGMGYVGLKTGAHIYPITIEGAERSKLSYLQDKLNTTMFPEVKITIGESYTIQTDESQSIHLQKEKAAYQILRVMQREVFRSRMKPNVQLFNELLQAAKVNGLGMMICEDTTQSLTYKKLLIAVYALAAKLKKLLKDEQIIGVFLPTSAGHVVTLFALFQRGKTPALLNFTMGRQALAECAETAGIKTLLTSRVFIEKGNLEPQLADIKKNVRILYLEDIKDTINAQDKIQAVSDFVAKKKAKTEQNEIILFTSGSESKPKGVILTHENLYANIMQLKSVVDITQKDTLLNALPMFHSNDFLPLLLPSKIHVVKNLPLLGSGKINYVTLKQWAESRRNDESKEV